MGDSSSSARVSTTKRPDDGDSKPSKRHESGSLDSAMAQVVLPLRRSLSRIERCLSSQTANLEAVKEQLDQLIVQQPIDSEPSEIENAVFSDSAGLPDEEHDLAVDDDKRNWENIILGSQLGQSDSLQVLRDVLQAAVFAKEEAARAFAAHLLLVQAIGPTEAAERLRDLGEAFYRWRPRANEKPDEIEQAVVDCINHYLASANVKNRIMLVNPGERFDKQKHLSATRGLNVTEVFGWIVLRENQTVYTKAKVNVL